MSHNRTLCHEHCSHCRYDDECFDEYLGLVERSYYFNDTTCLNYCKSHDYEAMLQKDLGKPMPWVGMYIAVASAAIAVAMAADVFNGFRKKRLWFPSRYFSLNAFSLTVLAVAVKLPVDLTSPMEGTNDQLARVSSLVLMSTAMTNFMASLGSMENNEILLNIAAIVIPVITVVGNVLIRLFEVKYHWDSKITSTEDVASTIFMLLLLVILCSSAVMVPTARRYIESQYNQMHNRILNEQVNHIGKFTNDELRVTVRSYGMMAESGSPQFVIARSVMCVALGVICLLAALTLLEAHIRIAFYTNFDQTSSDYKWSTNWILYIQSIGVALGTIAPLLRWFTAAQFKSNVIGHKSFKDELEVEAYWTQRLKHWRDSPLPLNIGHHKFKKFLHDAKQLLLNFCIGVQILLVRASKLVLAISATCIKRSNNFRVFESRSEMEMDLSRYVVLLEGEAGLPIWAQKNICNEMDKLIQLGKKKHSKHLIELLHKSVNFNGVRGFDSSKIQSLNSHLEPPNCWSLPVVTLASIAISLPSITYHKSKQLLTAVSEGLYFTRLIDKTLDKNGELSNIINAADTVWVGVELYKKWQDNDLKAAGQTHKERLQKLSAIAETIVTKFTAGANEFILQDPLNWPVQVIAANSMYRVTQTVLLAHDNDHPQTEEELFERLSVMISDILTACLTNLARVIMFWCHSNAIKEREKSIRRVALLLGESEEILEALQQHELPNLDPQRAASVEGWRAFMEQDDGHTVASVSATFPQTHILTKQIGGITNSSSWQYVGFSSIHNVYHVPSTTFISSFVNDFRELCNW